ncbi:MAG: methyltransferase domain-containing protein [Pseudomonadota bacterium]
MPKRFLDHAYRLNGAQETQAHFDAWANTYDAELSDNGYATPVRVAKALAEYCKDPNARILDYGCGTGLSGEALQLAGFERIDGMDPNEKMIAKASVKGIYRTLTSFDPAGPSPIPPNTYKVITCIGVIGIGAAPASTIDRIMEALPQNGLFGLSLNDHALSDPAYEPRLEDWVERDAARLLFKAYGAHLPGQNLFSNVYILEKT